MILLFELSFVYACFYDTSMLACMTHLWATTRGFAFPVTNSVSQDVRSVQYTSSADDDFIPSLDDFTPINGAFGSG
jgi:hypothetical protein